jgi:integrase
MKTLLRVAVEWNALEHPPSTVHLLHCPDPSEARFHDFDEYERLVEAAARIDHRALLLVLLGGEAGLRCGEMMTREWTDLDLGRRKLWVKRSDWRGKVTLPKGGRPRLMPMTARLAEALKQARHLRSPRVLAQDDGSPFTQRIVRVYVMNASRLANLENRGVHILRHTFCSHLAMRGAPARAIQELAGHQDHSTTQRYMHLSPRAVESAIRLLEEPIPSEERGDIVETGNPSDGKSKGLKQ